MDIFMSAYNPEWPAQFEAVKDELAGDLEDEGVSFLSIEHVGSTSVPNLPAKAVIDIMIVIPATDFDPLHLAGFKEALSWGKRQGGYHYIGDGGVKGRWSFKLWEREPIRHVYVVADGSLPLRSCRALRDTLRRHEGLRSEYGALKIQLAMRQYDNIMQYSTLKNPVIRKILREAGWTEEEIDEKESQSVTDWPRPDRVLPKRTCWDKVQACFFAVARAPSRCYGILSQCFKKKIQGENCEPHHKTNSIPLEW
ncbi:hypothetical protein P7C71_g3724, partial [Lecanoromycetidae sp. Uapishka_2]